jgi:hypothetical protein
VAKASGGVGLVAPRYDERSSRGEAKGGGGGRGGQGGGERSRALRTD